MPQDKQMKKKKAFYGWDVARFHLNFSNGNWLSTVWAEGTYSEEHDSTAQTNYLLKRTEDRPVFGSNTCEIMFDCPEKLKKRILKKYNDGVQDPIGYLPLKDWLEIVKLLSK